MIQHLILSGGGVFGFSCYGAVRECVRSGFLDMGQVKSIYATSVGSIVATMLSLRYDWEILDDFIMKRPWNQVFPIHFQTLCNSIEKRGLFDKTVMYDIFRPLLEGKDLSMDITLREFYEFSGIDFHCFSTEINDPSADFKLVDFSHVTHPEWRLLDALYCSACLPILFSPYFSGGGEKCFVDGAIVENYPARPFFESHPDVPLDSILGICKKSPDENKRLDDTSSLLDYIMFLVQRLMRRHGGAKSEATTSSLVHEVSIFQPPTNLYDVYLACSLQEERKRLFDVGTAAATATLKT